MSVAETKFATGSEEEQVATLITRARAAMEAYENDNQARVDEAVTALAWAIYKPENAKMLAELAVEDTGLGNVESKIIKNTRKTFGTLRDLMRARTVGVIEEIPEKGLVKYGKPVGVVGAGPHAAGGQREEEQGEREEAVAHRLNLRSSAASVKRSSLSSSTLATWAATPRQGVTKV